MQNLYTQSARFSHLVLKLRHIFTGFLSAPYTQLTPLEEGTGNLVQCYSKPKRYSREMMTCGLRKQLSRFRFALSVSGWPACMGE
ncbi:hypothetical protein Plhal304r1_c015g0055881 [Plasmopara halstedii]